MNRGQLSTRIQERLDRYDSTTQTQIDNMIDEVIRTVEQTYPLAYNKKSQDTPLTADENIYTLPATLIYHHPFDLMLENIAATSKYAFLVKTHDGYFNKWFSKINLSGVPEYWRITGGDNSNEFQLYPVTPQARNLKLGNGYYYSGAFTADAGGGEGDTESTWLTTYFPNLIIEGVVAELARLYNYTEKAAEASIMYQLRLNGAPEQGIAGLIPTEKKRNRKGRILRVKTMDDFPVATARKMRFAGG